MKIVVIGGTGLIGSKTVSNLSRLGHEVIAAAPNTGVNTLTGEGLAEALVGADVVVDVANSPSFEDDAAMAFFQTAGRNLLAAEQVAGVKHHVALSVVGTERLQASGYFRAKLAQEALIKASPTPYTILRSTQFFQFVGGIVHSAAAGDAIRLPPVPIQPIAADDVAAVLAKVVVSPPVNGTIEVAGPESFRLDTFAEQYLDAQQDPRDVVADPQALYFGAALDDRSLMPGPDSVLGEITFEDWLNESMAAD
ncbi:SDR family oxidoreductase [Caulobacter sp. LjRoot300]|uniref:SDR family oxidoreductase n=1 Tax=Caulobacter sp. LjRoot300 TaxID=3342321 RepID=UPI003ECD21D6